MKKSLVLAMAMALGVTASAYAANPFSDVPAGHWAYDSISKLAAAGVIEGYGDDTFRGDRLMTRYEMAQIVAKAMGKGANVNKLAAEFADELDALGVRVAALEKKSDNVKITGQVRYRWTEGSPAAGNIRRRGHILRTRLTFNGQINENWKYTGMLQNQQFFQDDVGNENTDFQRANVSGRVGGVKVVAGRINDTLFEGDTYDTRTDAIHLAYGDKLKIEGWYGKPTGINGVSRTGAAVAPANGNYSVYAGGRLGYDWDKFGIYVESDKFSQRHRLAAGAANNNQEVAGVVLKGKFGDFGAVAQLLHGKIKNVNTGKKTGWTLGVNYKGANAAKPGTWGIGVKYYDMGGHTYVPGCTTWDAYDNFAAWGTDGFKGWRINADYTFAKNIRGEVQYYDVKGKGANKAKARTFVADIYFTF